MLQTPPSLPPSSPSPQGPPQDNLKEMLPGIIHLIQSLGGKAQGALGSVGADNSKEKLAGGGLNSAIMSALQKILGNPKAKEGMPEPPPNG